MSSESGVWWLMLEEIAVIYLDFTKALDPVSESSAQNWLSQMIRESWWWRRLHQMEERYLNFCRHHCQNKLINQCRLASSLSLLLVSVKTFQLQAITSSIAQVRAFDELLPVPCGQQSSSELSLFFFIQFHLPLLEFKNYCRSSCAGNLIFMTPELDLRPKLEFLRAFEIHLQIQLSILCFSEDIQPKPCKSLSYTAILICKHMHVISGRVSDFCLYLILSFYLTCLLILSFTSDVCTKITFHFSSLWRMSMFSDRSSSQTFTGKKNPHLSLVP